MRTVILIAFLASIFHGYRALILSGTKRVDMDAWERWILALNHPYDWIAVVAFPVVILLLSLIPSNLLIPSGFLAYTAYGISKSFRK